VDRAVHSRRVGLQEDPHRAQIESPPASASLATVIPRASLTAPPAATLASSAWPHVGDHEIGLIVILDLFDDRVVDAQKGAP
jgi:hypothetical protein